MKNISKEQFEKLCAMFCPEQEICEFFGVSQSTIYEFCLKTYGEPFKTACLKFRALGKAKLRGAQINLAAKSAQMAMYLGQKYLEDQRDGFIVKEEQKELNEFVAMLTAAVEAHKDE